MDERAAKQEEQETKRAGELQQARFTDYLNTQKDIEFLASRVTTKLNKLIEEGHATAAFMIAGSLALLKDLLDIFSIVIPILSPFLTAVLFLFWWGKGWFNKGKIKVGRWILAQFFDNIPVLSMLPIATLQTLLAWRAVRKQARKAEMDLASLKSMSHEELTSLDEEYGDEEYEHEDQQYEESYA